MAQRLWHVRMRVEKYRGSGRTTGIVDLYITAPTTQKLDAKIVAWERKHGVSVLAVQVIPFSKDGYLHPSIEVL